MFYLPHRRLHFRGAASHWSANGATLDPLDDYMVAYWALEDTADSKGSHTLVNTGATTFTSGKNNNAGTLNGSSQKLQAPSSSDFNIYGTDWTISFWLKPSTTANTVRVICFDGASDNTTGIYFRASNQLTIGRFGISEINPGIALSTDEFVHICITKVDTTTKIYKNYSTTVSSTTEFFTDRDYLCNLGGPSNNSSGGSYSGGQMDEVAIWKGHGMSASEVSALYNSGTGAFWSP